MSTALRLLLFFVICNGVTSRLLCPANARASEAVPGAVISAFNASRTRIEQFSRDHGFEHAFISKPFVITSRRSSSYQEEVYIFRSTGAYNFEILSNGRVIGFMNDRAFEKADALEFDSPTQASWEKSKAIALAQDFVVAVLGSLPNNIGTPSAGFHNQNRNAPKYLMGAWTVSWPRIDERTGQPFAGDDISVQLFEREGPYSINVNMPAHFAGVNFTPLQEKDVLAEAVAASKEMVKWGPIRGMFKDGTLADAPAKSYLMIVRPNHWGQPQVQDIHGSRDLNARLAWVFWFPWYLKNQAPEPANAPRALAVWIDAENKAWLGGDAGSK